MLSSTNIDDSIKRRESLREFYKKKISPEGTKKIFLEKSIFKRIP